MRADVGHALRDLGLAVLRSFRPKPRFCAHGQVRVERVALEDHGDVALARVQLT